TNTISAADRQYTVNKATEAEKNANIYTDSKIKDSEASTKNYIDNSAENTYNRSVDYTDSRINESNQSVIDYSTRYTDNSSEKTLNQANNYTDNRFNESVNYTNNKFSEVNGRVDRLNNKIDENDRRAKAGIAGAMAMSGIPQRFDYNFNFGMAAGTYGGEQAISAGSFWNVTENTTVATKISLDTQHNVGGTVGFAVGW
ncbi:YadA-like family protein, partial [Salmonella enterica]|nr:YadA-like family protein [Salmonella enterica subsp. enterica]EKT1325905.1 YadA-like family protein [Salmonella enterica]EKT1359024.1 YadA-like family protein [Salmonella enterica]EKT3224048.1 YadA-like family protein [Salmonella enterica]EKT3330681.1 YadA-like family protein [Salmonella enterica]